MKKLLGIIVLGLLLSGNAFSEETYLACGKKNKDKTYIVFNNETVLVCLCILPLKYSEIYTILKIL